LRRRGDKIKAGLTPTEQFKIDLRELQCVLAEPGWWRRMAAADRRGLSPLVWGHVSPYGVFDLDMGSRLDFEVREAA
jgi:hypothetical protein